MSLTTFQALPLRVAVLAITIRPEDKMRLGQYPAMTLRGGLGYSLRKVACDCESQKHDEHCLYAQLYEEKSGVMRDALYIPYIRPCIIRTGENKQFLYEAHDRYTFEIVLFGDAINEISTILLALKAFGRAGIGEEKHRFYIEQVVEQLPAKRVIIYEQDRLLKTVTGYSPLNSDVQPQKKMKLQLQTPLRLQLDGQYLQTVPIEAFADNLLRRIRSILYFHHNGFFVGDTLIEQLVEFAFTSYVSTEHYHYVAYNRFSTRQKKKIALDGIVGELTLENVPAELVALLEAGKSIHLGKQTAFGFGQYDVLYYE